MPSGRRFGDGAGYEHCFSTHTRRRVTERVNTALHPAAFHRPRADRRRPAPSPRRVHHRTRFRARGRGPLAGDADRFDEFCDHLLVREDNTGELVGCYRMLPPPGAIAAGGLYTATEFDVSGLDPLRPSLPGLGASGDGAAQEELSARLAGLALPACPAGSAPASAGDVAGAPFPVVGAGGELATTLASVSVEPRGEDWDVTLAEADNAVTFSAGAGSWTVSDPDDQHGGHRWSLPAVAGPTVVPCGWRSSSWRRRTGWTSSSTRTARPPLRPGGSRPCSRATWPIWPVLSWHCP